MPIKASSASQIEALVADLGSDRTMTREAAAARLTVLGTRAVDRLITLVHSDGSSTARALAIRTLEAIADPRALDRVLEAIDAGDSLVAAAAVSAARAFLRGPRGATAVDRLTTVVMDRARDDALRIAALQVLRELEPSTVAPLLKSLEHDPSGAVQTAARRTTSATPVETIIHAAEQGLPDNAQDLAEALGRAGNVIPLPVLLRIIERVRDREASLPAADRSAWTLVRGRGHVALAKRGSRLALYDLREAIETATTPLPVEFLAALSIGGDTSCVEAVARAYQRTTTSAGDRDDWWRDHLADVFRAIVTRERMTRRHHAIKKLDKRIVDALWP